MSEEDIRLGSLSISEDVHEFLARKEMKEGAPLADAPFNSIVEAFRFAFALGFSVNQRTKRKGETKTVAPRQFVVMEYYDLLEDEARKEGVTLGALVSEYAEAGGRMMIEYSENPDRSILSMVSTGGSG